jgi:hypothetical protein
MYFVQPIMQHVCRILPDKGYLPNDLLFCIALFLTPEILLAKRPHSRWDSGFTVWFTKAAVIGSSGRRMYARKKGICWRDWLAEKRRREREVGCTYASEGSNERVGPLLVCEEERFFHLLSLYRYPPHHHKFKVPR